MCKKVLALLSPINLLTACISGFGEIGPSLLLYVRVSLCLKPISIVIDLDRNIVNSFVTAGTKKTLFAYSMSRREETEHRGTDVINHSAMWYS